MRFQRIKKENGYVVLFMEAGMFDIDVLSELEQTDLISTFTNTTLVTDMAMTCGFGLCYIPKEPTEYTLFLMPCEIGYKGV